MEVYYIIAITVICILILYFLFKQNFTQFHTYGAEQRYQTEFSGTNQRPYMTENFVEHNKQIASNEAKTENPNIFKDYMNLIDARSPREESSLFKKLILENQVV